jgi:hypothetical protein
MNHKRTLAMRTMTLAIVTALGLTVTSAHASLQLLAPGDFQGTGLGSVNTILTMQSPPQTSSESASVSFGNIITGDASEQTQTRTLGELGVTSAYTLRVVFNANEPGGDANSISLDNLVLTIYSPTGSVLFTSGAFTSHFFPDTLTGIGNSGWVFGFDATQAAAAQSAAFGGAFGANVVGLSAAASLATDGHETFFVANAPIPEPGTLALLGSGLLALGGIGRRRKIS